MGIIVKRIYKYRVFHYFNLLIKIILIGYPECKAALLNRDLLPTIQTILSKKSFSPLIVTSILKLLELLSRSSEGIKYMKKNNSLEAIVSSMEKHPYEKELLSNGSTILSKIVTMSDLNNILTILKNNDKNNSSLINISIFSQLALIDDMMDEILRQGALIDLIKIMELNLDENINESPDKIILIKNCCIALGRIIEVDLKQFLGVVDLGALNLLKSLLIEVKNPEIIEVGLHTLNKLAKNTEIFALIEKEDFLGLVLKNIFYWKNENCCEALLIFLILQAEKGSSEILAQNGLEIIIKIMETHMIQKKVVEKVKTILFSLFFYYILSLLGIKLFINFFSFIF